MTKAEMGLENPADTERPLDERPLDKQVVSDSAPLSAEISAEPGGDSGAEPTAGSSNASLAEPAGTQSGHRWTFLTNHSHVLVLLYRNPDLVLREVASQVGITERAVQRIVQDLEEAGFLRRRKIGRQNHYEVLTDKPLRHPVESHRNIADLLNLISNAND